MPPRLAPVLGALALLAASCATIPTTAISLADQLHQHQAQHVEHITALTESFGQVLELEAERQLAPLVALERRAAADVTALQGMLAVEAHPPAPIPTEFAANPRVAAFHTALNTLEIHRAQWQAWVAVARKCELLYSAVQPSGGTPTTFTHAHLADPNSVQRKLVDELLNPASPPPDNSVRAALQSNWANYDSALGRNDAAADRVGRQVEPTLKAILRAARADELDAAFAALRVELITTLGQAQAIHGSIRDTLRDKRSAIDALTVQASRDLTALRTNAEEVERGLDALALALRQGRESFYGPKNTIVTGLKSLSQNLGELGVLDPGTVDTFATKLDGLSSKFDSIFQSLETAGA